MSRSIRSSLRNLSLYAVLAMGLATVPAPTVAQGDADCPFPPLTLPLFSATPAAQVAATPIAGTASTALDEAGAEEAMEIIISCANSGDAGVAYSIFTERYLASLFADPSQTYQPAFEVSIDQGDTGSEGTLELVSIDSVTALPDGRTEIIATMETDTATFTDTFVLVSVDGNWLIDDVTNFDPPK